MIVLNVAHVQKSFAGDVVLKDATLMIREKEKVALVGQNGTGKSTLLKIIASQIPADEGTIAFKKGVKVGYLPQEAQFDSNSTLYDEVESVFDKLLSTETRMRAVEQEMGRPEVYNHPELLQQKMKEYAALTEVFERQEGFQIKAKINSILLGLGFDETQFSQPVSSMSGGEKTRVLLAKLLLQEPDILLMDEPTNHLDVQAIQWLESYLKDYRGAVLIVSHDRFFLDETVSRVYEMSKGRCTEYQGNYSDYASQKQTELLIQQASYEAQQKELRRLERAWKQTLAWAHQSRSHKLKVKADNIKRRLDRIQRIDRPNLNPQTMHVDLSTNQRSGKDVLTLENVEKRLPGRVLFTGVSLQLKLGDKVALIGPNGVGKSTLLRLIMGFDQPDAGSIRLGASVHLAYYDQQHLELNQAKTCFDEIMDTKRMNNLQARSLLAQFMFTGDDVFKTIGQLSGGEKSRLQLAKLTITDANFLILDEPTNHLDLPSTEVLEKALADFDGTILFVSHDRYFINQVANRVAELTPTGINIYEGNYDVYLEEKARQAKKQQRTETEAAESRGKTKHRQEQSKADSEPDPIKQLKAQLLEVEKNIEKLETAVSHLEQQMTDPEVLADPARLASAAREHKTATEELNLLYRQWEQLTDQLP